MNYLSCLNEIKTKQEYMKKTIAYKTKSFNFVWFVKRRQFFSKPCISIKICVIRGSCDVITGLCLLGFN
jgi:hypothetical protein